MKHRKYIPLLILVFVFILLIPTSFVKAEEKSLVGSTTVYEGQKDKTVEISLYIHGGEKIAGGSLNLLYDKTALTVQKAEIGDQLSGYLTSVNIEQTGKVSLEWANATEQMQEGTLLTITAKLLKTNEMTDLDLQDVKLFDEDYAAIAVDSFDGEVKPFKGIEKKHESKVKNNKEWNVRFNHQFNQATVNKHTVLVKDSKGNEMDVNVKVRDSKVLVVTPKADYASGTYTLVITEQVRALNGSQLKEPIKYEFSVE